MLAQQPAAIPVARTLLGHQPAKTVRRVGFSGTREGASVLQLTLLTLAAVQWWEPGAEFHHGCCAGADEEATRLFKAARWRIVGHPPTVKALISRRALALCDELRPAQPYLTRNQNIVTATAGLLAAPATAQEQQRSGTWATVRFARRSGRPVVLLAPAA